MSTFWNILDEAWGCSEDMEEEDPADDPVVPLLAIRDKPEESESQPVAEEPPFDSYYVEELDLDDLGDDESDESNEGCPSLGDPYAMTSPLKSLQSESHDLFVENPVGMAALPDTSVSAEPAPVPGLDEDQQRDLRKQEILAKVEALKTGCFTLNSWEVLKH